MAIERVAHGHLEDPGRGRARTRTLGIAVNVDLVVLHATVRDRQGRVASDLREQDFEIYEFVSPNGEIIYNGEIDVTNQQWKDISDFKWSIKSASCK